MAGTGHWVVGGREPAGEKGGTVGLRCEGKQEVKDDR